MAFKPAQNTPIDHRLDSEPLIDELNLAYRTLRLTLVQLLREVRVDPRSGAQIATELKINRQLAWQLATIASEPACEIGLNVLPGARGLQLFADACSRVLGSPVEIESFQAAIESLESTIRTHAGDRPSLGLLTAAWDPTSVEDRTESLRRDGFRAQCAMLGVQVATQVRGVILAPSRTGDASKVTMASYQAFNDLVRLRRDRACRLLFVEAPTHDDGTLAMPADAMAQHMHEKFVLERDLCSSAEGIDIVVEGMRGWVVLRPGPIGRAGSGTWVFTGSATHEHPRHRSERDQFNHVGINTYVPTETIYIDCLMHRDLIDRETLERTISVGCFDASTGNPMRPVSRADPAFLFDLGSRAAIGPDELACDPVMPGLADIVDRASRRVGCRVNDLIGVRYRSSYAMSPTSFIVSRELSVDARR